MKRREFIKAAAVSTVAAPAASTDARNERNAPLTAAHRIRKLRLMARRDNGLTIITDGPPNPRKLIRPDIIDQAFGAGTYNVLSQPDHWEMIDQGWFKGADLFQPRENVDQEWWIWQCYFRPENEAHDILYNLLSDQIQGVFGGSVPELGLHMGEHPCSPRLATAWLSDSSFIGRFSDAVSKRSKWLVVDQEVIASDN